MRQARYTIAPSECFENQPLGVLESMGHGKPLIASRLGGLAEIVQDRVTGLLVPPQDPAALAAAMTELWNNEDSANEMGARAWAYAKEQFSPAKQTSRLVDLYAGLLNHQRVDFGD
jgi:glycosyltransferase involved in cell wall biosynthesis